jgi:hypothetical protein
MKKYILLSLLIAGFVTVQAQASRADVLQDLEKNKTGNQNFIGSATVNTATRLFGAKDDLTTVIMILPSGSQVKVLDADTDYLHVLYEENEGYILKRHASMDKVSSNNLVRNESTKQVVTAAPQQEKEMTRYEYLENKYGPKMATRLVQGKVWKGMNAEMARDSWGSALKINRTVKGNVVCEEWIFRTTWLYFENNILTDWGPTQK